MAEPKQLDEKTLAEITERCDELQHATLHGAVPLKTTMQLVIDIDSLSAHIAWLEGENANILNFFGAEMKENGTLSINMPKYHAAHVCETHQWLPPERKVFEKRCPVCVIEGESKLAESTRTLLIEVVKGKRDGWLDKETTALRAKDGDYDRAAYYDGKATAADEIMETITALEATELGDK